MITKKEYAERRQRVMKVIGPQGIVILPAAAECMRSGEADYLYRQDSDFYYLSGFKEPEAVLVLAPGRKEGEYILFNRQRDPNAETWVGVRVGQTGAVKDYDADQAFPIESISEKMPELLANYRQVYFPIGKDADFDKQVIGWVKQITKHVRSGIGVPTTFVNVQDIIHEMRLRKSPAEIELLRIAAKVSAQAHTRAMQTCRPEMTEYQLQAELLYEFSRGHCYPPAYNSIVASGPHACVLHYVDNHDQLKNGDLVLIDAGGEYEYYAADITRTFPVNGRFSKEQRAIYEIVLDAQKSTIATIKPGLPWEKLQEQTVHVITKGLLQLGLLQGDLQNLIAERAWFHFYMHQVTHWLGLDVHDAGKYKVDGQWRLLEEGMVLTIEPGIYIRPDEKIDKKWWNIGVRIEDDILVTAQGHEILTDAVPKEIIKIEALMNASSAKAKV